MSKIDEIMNLIRDMEANTPGIEASAVVSVQGLPIASAMPNDVDESVVAAMTAAMLSVGERAAQELVRGNLQQILLQGDEGYIIIKGAGMSAIITVLAKNDANLGLILMVLKKISARISELLSEE
ncbi:MAG: roadblock/LC7 domain-containing protein [Candidatus Freyarchaeota archaeon]|nr:roadblock/LC7 domain-containing protein [Candidatus Freyarchaeota archaeon]MDO8090756.1 roadblock/LC7 domain-containing protein [Candidatus Sigynarchaeota archaeon]